MHRHHYQKLAATCWSFVWLLLAVAGCTTADPCQDSVCSHGICVDGSCLCEAIYEGRNCDTLASTKFLGENWTNDVLCHGPGYSLSAKVRAGAQEGSLVVYNALAQDDSLQAVAHRDTILVAQQVYGTGSVQGSGLYSPTAFTMELVLLDAFGQETHCVAVLRR